MRSMFSISYASCFNIHDSFDRHDFVYFREISHTTYSLNWSVNALELSRFACLIHDYDIENECAKMRQLGQALCCII